MNVETILTLSSVVVVIGSSMAFIYRVLSDMGYLESDLGKKLENFRLLVSAIEKKAKENKNGKKK